MLQINSEEKSILKQIYGTAQFYYNGLSWNRFDHKNAYFTEQFTVKLDTGEHVEVQLFKSYCTVMGMATNWNGGFVVEFGKYSSTTSKQFSQWYNKFHSDYTRVFIGD